MDVNVAGESVTDGKKMQAWVRAAACENCGARRSFFPAALGACVIEKHFVLSRDEGGIDSSFSLEPDEFKAMISAVRTAEASLGRAEYATGEAERRNRRYRRSLFAVADICEGELLTKENVRSIRPADGMHPRYLDDVLGCRAAKGMRRGTPLSSELIEKRTRGKDDRGEETL